MHQTTHTRRLKLMRPQILLFVLAAIFIVGLAFSTKMGLPIMTAQTLPSLFTPVATSQPLLGANDLGVVRYQAVTLDTSVLEQARARLTRKPVQESLIRLQLFGDVRLEVALERFERAAKTEVYFGRIKEVEGSAVHLTVTDGVMSGSIALPGKFYAVRYAGSSLHMVQEINQSLFPGGQDAIPVRPEPTSPASTTDDGSLVDVMVVYTPAARNGAGGTAAIQSLITLGISETNTAFANSQVIQRFRLVHTEEVNYTESGDFVTDLNRLSGTSDGFMDNVHTLRDTQKADLVTLLINSPNTSCGIGYLMSGNNPGFATSAFNVTLRTCVSPNYSFGHELGHNQGLNHARQDPIGTGAFSYSFGYKDTTNLFRDIMSYNCTSGCPRVLHFSNPAVNYNGRPTGVVSTAPDSADNAQSLNNTRVTIANFRSGGPDPCATVTPITVGQTVTGQLSATDCTIFDGSYIDKYSFNGTAGQQITISLNSTAFDAYLWLLDAAGNSVAQDNSGGGGTNARIPAGSGFFTLPATGAYTIWANSFTGGETGSYTLSLTGPVSCTYTINPTTQNFPGNGGTGSVSVTTGAGCTWTATSNAAWITITSGASGNGNGTVNYSVTANPNPSLRTGTITIAGQTFTVTQSAAACTFTINPTSQSFAANGGTGSVSVTGLTGCTWTATSNAAWLTITSGASGNGNGTVNYSVAANTGAQRTGTMTIAGQTFTVTQAAGTTTTRLVRAAAASGAPGSAVSMPIELGIAPK